MLVPGPASAGPTPRAGPGRCPVRVGGRARAGPRRNCRVGFLHALRCLSFLLLPGGGGDEQSGSSGDPVLCDVSSGRRAWKRAGTRCRQMAGFPSPCLREGLFPVDAAGTPCPPRPSLEGSRGQGKGAPGGLCATLRPGAALRGLQRRPQDFLPPGVLKLAGPWHALNPGPGASWWP